MSVDDYEWHYDYARLAWDLGFTFQTLRAKPSLDKNIGHIDIEQVIRERDVATIERHIGTVIEFKLDNDQTSVLDPTFVKVFRFSQLSVQYLLFCKKYLDNTVVLIKKKFGENNEESKNLKHYVEELHQEITNSRKQIKELKAALNCQVASNKNSPIYQCTECPKAFSSDEYLSAHMKRRHQGVTSTTTFQAETDKLQLEIKQLKERLNNTEKFIHSDEPQLKQDSNYSTKNNSSENLLLKDLQQKFELLKNHVENELRILQTQKFDQDKYEQWFDTFLKKLELTQGTKKEETNLVNVVKPKENHPTMEEVLKTDGETQTDDFVAVCKNCAERSPVLEKVAQIPIQSANGDAENMKAENNLEIFQKMLENKVTGSIEKLETQMQDFWNKMNEAEKQKIPTTNNPTSDVKQKNNNNTKSNTSIESIEVVPKPRKKVLTKPPVQKQSKTQLKPKPKPREIIKTTHIKLPNPPVLETITIKEAGINFKTDSDTESEISEDSESSESSDEDDKRANIKPSTTSTLGQRSLTSLKEAAFTPEVLRGLQKEVENVLNSRLEEIGVSPEWSALPIRSYQRALNIVTHQASLIQKNITNYMQIRGQILKDVDAQSKNAPQKRSKLKTLFTNIKNKAPLVKKPVVAIKAPEKTKMYELGTESDSSSVIIDKKNYSNITDQTQKAYFNVIQELNSKTKLDEEVAEIPEAKLEEDVPKKVEIEEDKIETQAKGVLKNYPSVGSLQKKKVIFDLESSLSEKEPVKPVVLQKEPVKLAPPVKVNEGSTTSIASSVLDESIEKIPEKKSELSDVSDWDLSDILVD